jgi:hypothetical protein
LAVAVSSHARSRAPRAKSRRAFRYSATLPAQPVGVEVLAAVRHARQQHGRAFAWDARLETSAIAVLGYLWRRGRGEKWAGRCGSARYACSIAQLVMGLAEIMGWRNIPNRRNTAAVARFVKAHRASVQRWLDWLRDAGLVSHTPQQDEDGFWWRTIIELHPCPQLPAELLREAVERRAGWPERERRRQARGRRRNLTAILRRARLSRSERRARSLLRRQLLERHAERQRVRQAVADSLAQTVRSHLRQPFGASTTSRTSLDEVSQDETSHRRLTRAHALVSKPASAKPRQTPVTQREAARTGEETRWEVYNEIMAARWARSDQEWEPFLAGPARRVEELLNWSESVVCPRWRLIECWTIAAYGPQIAAAGGFRLALWSEQAEHHGPRLERALARYQRFSDAGPPGWPASPAAALAHFFSGHVRRQDGPEHGMAYDVARFNELTKQMSAYAHYQRGQEHFELAAKRAARRARARELVEQLNQRLRFRLPDHGPAVRLQTARQLLDSEHPSHQAAGRTLYAGAQRELRLEQRDERLRAGRHPGDTDGRYRAACRYAQRWGLPLPAGRREGMAG